VPVDVSLAFSSPGLVDPRAWRGSRSNETSTTVAPMRAATPGSRRLARGSPTPARSAMAWLTQASGVPRRGIPLQRSFGAATAAATEHPIIGRANA
jgi:hypothetical protein